MKKKGGTGSKNKIILFIFIMCLLVAGALLIYYQCMKQQQKQSMEKTPTTEAEKLIAKDLEAGYPETPAEFMKLWGRMNQCLYNSEGLGDDEFEALVKQLRLMYSSDLLAQNEESAHIKKLREEIETFQDNKNKIANYSADTGTNVQYKTVNKRECAYLSLSYLISRVGSYRKTYQDFVLVKEDGKWKVLGFADSKQESSSGEKKDK